MASRTFVKTSKIRKGSLKGGSVTAIGTSNGIVTSYFKNRNGAVLFAKESKTRFVKKSAARNFLRADLQLPKSKRKSRTRTRRNKR